MTNVTKVIEVKFTANQVSALKNGYEAFKSNAKKTLQDGVKLGLLLVAAKDKFHKTLTGMNEQTINQKFGKFITDEIGVSKSHRNLLIQIVSFDGMLKAIKDGKVNSITEAREYMKPTNSAKNSAENGAGESDDESNEGESITKRILANAAKELGVAVTLEEAKTA
jgi:hypothetical protein